MACQRVALIAEIDGGNSALLPHAAVESYQAALTHRQRIGELPPQHERVAGILLGREVRGAAALRRAGHVLQARREIVDQHHVLDRLVAQVVEADREVDRVARKYLRADRRTVGWFKPESGVSS